MKFTFAPESRPLEGYTIKRAIYRGGFGEVYYALTDAGREVALKLLQNNSEVELRGVQQCLNLSHPNLVTIFDVKQDRDNDHWIVMEYVAGETLDAAIHRCPDGMPMEEVRNWLRGMADGVAFLHEQGIVHRDLKPGNVFSEASVVKIGDVGLSKFITPSRRSAQTQSVGTVYYMAPEVAKGRYGREVDVYALGVILYEMITGRVPFEGESTGEILMKHLSEQPDLEKLPPRLRPVIGKALQKDPTRRFASVRDLQQAFEAAVIGKFRPANDRTSEVVEEEHRVNQTPRVAPVRTRAGDETVGNKELGDSVWPPTSRVLWIIFICGLAGLFLTGEPVTLIGVMVTGISLFWLIRLLMNPPRSAEQRSRIGVLPEGIFQAARKQNPAGHSRRQVNAPSPHVARHYYRHRKTSPGVVRPISFRTRMSQYATSATLVVPIVALLTGSVTLLSPGFFVSATAGSPGWENIGLFASTAVMASWMLMGLSKWNEGRRLDGGTRRLLQMVGGVGVGLAAYFLSEALLIPETPPTEVYAGTLWAQPSDPMFVSLGNRPLFFEGGRPSLLGFVAFFGVLFGLRRWWWHADSFRAKRFRIGSVLLTVLLAWVVSSIWAFPSIWAMTWAAVISSTVQLASIWIPPEERFAGREV